MSSTGHLPNPNKYKKISCPVVSGTNFPRKVYSPRARIKPVRQNRATYRLNSKVQNFVSSYLKQSKTQYYHFLGLPGRDRLRYKNPRLGCAKTSRVAQFTSYLYRRLCIISARRHRPSSLLLSLPQCSLLSLVSSHSSPLLVRLCLHLWRLAPLMVLAMVSPSCRHGPSASLINHSRYMVQHWTGCLWHRQR